MLFQVALVSLASMHAAQRSDAQLDRTGALQLLEIGKEFRSVPNMEEAQPVPQQCGKPCGQTLLIPEVHYPQGPIGLWVAQTSVHRGLPLGDHGQGIGKEDRIERFLETEKGLAGKPSPNSLPGGPLLDARVIYVSLCGLQHFTGRRCRKS